MEGPTSDVIATVRRFNRSHSRRSGTLAASFLESGRPYGPSRVLFEIGATGTSTLDLRTRLGLDSGYLSRLLRLLESESLISLSRDPDDGRRRLVRLTAVGERAWHDLDARSDAHAAEMIAGLAERQRRQLVEALATADRLLAVTEIRLDLVDPRSPQALAALTAYFAELDERFTDGFDPGDTLVADAPALRRPHGCFVVAMGESGPIACGGLQRFDDTTGEIKRMWVHADWRGIGLGRRMLARLERAALDLGRTRVVLDTNAGLTEAINMYERGGYVAIERYSDNPVAQRWFAKQIAG